jgi:hypothetical protein
VALTAAGADLALALGIGALRTTAGGSGQHRAEGWLPTVAVALILAAPGILAVTGAATDRPVLYGAAGIACLPLAVVSVAAVPIWLPAIGFLGAFTLASPTNLWTRADGLTIAGFVALLLVALAMVLAVNGQYSYTSPGGGTEAGDYILPSRAAASLVVVLADLVLASTFANRARR